MLRKVGMEIFADKPILENLNLKIYVIDNLIAVMTSYL